MFSDQRAAAHAFVQGSERLSCSAGGGGKKKERNIKKENPDEDSGSTVARGGFFEDDSETSSGSSARPLDGKKRRFLASPLGESFVWVSNAADISGSGFGQLAVQSLPLRGEVDDGKSGKWDAFREIGIGQQKKMARELQRGTGLGPFEGIDPAAGPLRFLTAKSQDTPDGPGPLLSEEKRQEVWLGTNRFFTRRLLKDFSRFFFFG